MSRVLAVMACGFTLAACSTSMSSLNFLGSSPQTEALRIESNPPGADAKTSLGQNCRTPCELSVQPGSEFSVTLALNGYQPQTVAVAPQAAAAGPRLAPNPVFAELQPMAAAPPRKPAKKKPVATANRPAATSPVASAAPPPAPAPASAAAVPVPATNAEPAASATNYPWPSR
jgi:hypothetical protein